MKGRVFGFLAVAFIFVVGACGGSSSPKAASNSTGSSKSSAAGGSGSPSTNGGSAATATLHAKFIASGFESFTITFDSPLDNLDFGQGCSDLATKGTEGSDESTPEFVLPSLNGEVDGHTVVVGVLATGLHGPGSYTAGEQNSVTVDAPQDAEGENLFSAGDSSQVGKITINGDGSGTLTFANWLDNGGSDNTLSGELDWTCS